MKIIFLSFVFLFATNCFSQTLKDSLFRGKLKVDSSLIIKSKGNPQYSKSDSANKNQNVIVSATDSLKNPGVDSLQKQNTTEKAVINFSDNPKIWKKFVDQYSAIINTEVLPAKKIKKGTYTVMIDYEIGTDGMVTTKKISAIPENDFLAEQVRDKMMANAPQLAAMISNGVPRKSTKRQTLFFTKDKN